MHINLIPSVNLYLISQIFKFLPMFLHSSVILIVLVPLINQHSITRCDLEALITGFGGREMILKNLKIRNLAHTVSIAVF